MPHSASLGLRAAVLAFAAAPTLLAQDSWLFDVDQARLQARDRGCPVLVCVQEAGDAASAAMAVEYASSRFARVQRQVVPVLVEYLGDGEGDRGALTAGVDVDQVRRDAMGATLALFGPGATVTTPQQILLDGRGDVLWHNLGPATAAEIERAALSVRGALRDDDRARARRAVRAAQQLARDLRRDAGAAEKLRTLARHAPEPAFAEVVDLAQRHGIAARELVSAAVASLPVAVRKQRVAAMHGRQGCRSLCALLDSVEQPPMANDAPWQREREVFGPLPELRGAEDLDQVRFADGATRTLAGLRGSIVVLWLFLPDAPDLARQAAAVAPVIEELMADGVQVLAIGAHSDPDAARDVAARGLLPCPIGIQRWTPEHPWQGVDYFPAAVVLDQDGRVVYDDHGPGTRTYGAFAAVARGLQRHLEARPRLVHLPQR